MQRCAAVCENRFFHRSAEMTLNLHSVSWCFFCSSHIFLCVSVQNKSPSARWKRHRFLLLSMKRLQCHKMWKGNFLYRCISPKLAIKGCVLLFLFLPINKKRWVGRWFKVIFPDMVEAPTVRLFNHHKQAHVCAAWKTCAHAHMLPTSAHQQEFRISHSC